MMTNKRTTNNQRMGLDREGGRDGLAELISAAPGPVLSVFLPRVGGETTVPQIRAAFAAKGFGQVQSVSFRPFRNGSGWQTAMVRFQIARTPRSARLVARLLSGAQWRLHYSRDVSWWNWPMAMPRERGARDEWRRCGALADNNWRGRRCERTAAEMHDFVQEVALAGMA